MDSGMKRSLFSLGLGAFIAFGLAGCDRDALFRVADEQSQAIVPFASGTMQSSKYQVRVRAGNIAPGKLRGDGNTVQTRPPRVINQGGEP